MNLILIITSVLIILAGLAINHYKFYDLIAGYNSMPPEEKALFDIEKYSLIMRNTFVAMGFVIITGVLISIITRIEFIGLIFFFIAIFTGLTFLLIKGQKIRNSNN
jgi:hypothetical protein